MSNKYLSRIANKIEEKYLDESLENEMPSDEYHEEILKGDMDQYIDPFASAEKDYEDYDYNIKEKTLPSEFSDSISEDYVSRASLNKVFKIANKIAKKYAQVSDGSTLLDWLNQNFDDKAKSEIINEIWVAVDGFKTLTTVVSIKNEILIADAIVDGVKNGIASKILEAHILLKKPDLVKYDNSTTAWISYPIKKSANKLSAFIKKYAEEPIIDYENAFQTWLNEHYKQADKNRILNKINQSIDDLTSCSISLYVRNKSLKVISIVNGAENSIANKIVSDDVFPLIKNELPKFAEGSKFEGWITYKAK